MNAKPEAPRLETERFYLRPLSCEDATERYLGWLRDPEIADNLSTDGSNQTLESLRQYIAGHDNKNKFLFGIFDNDDRHIGTHSFRHHPQHRRATVGVLIGDKAFWGAAVPLETRGRLLTYAFEELDCNKVEAGCYSHNTPAIYNFRRQGWVLEGTRKQYARIGDAWSDMLFFAIFRDAWQKRRG